MLDSSTKRESDDAIPTYNLLAVVSSQSNNLHAWCDGSFHVCPDTQHRATQYEVVTRPQPVFTPQPTYTVTVPNTPRTPPVSINTYKKLSCCCDSWSYCLYDVRHSCRTEPPTYKLMYRQTDRQRTCS